jgi:hypothetical protein
MRKAFVFLLLSLSITANGLLKSFLVGFRIVRSAAD